MTRGERVQKIRKSKGMTLETFGSSLGVAKTTISRIEKGVNNLTDQMAMSICRTYNVNYNWLMDGGDVSKMFNPTPTTTLDKLCEEYNCDDIDRNLLKEYLALNPEQRSVLKEYVRRVLEGGQAAENG